MEIKVGEYVRTTDGYIGKLVEITDATNYYKIDVGREIQHMNYIKDNYIYSRDGFGHKHSRNIIDLIEEGDYVNGYKVAKVFNNINKHKGTCNCIDTELWFVDDDNSFQEIVLRDIEFKTVVTKEQMREMEYKVNE